MVTEVELFESANTKATIIIIIIIIIITIIIIIYLLQLCCHPVAVVILHVYKL